MTPEWAPGRKWTGATVRVPIVFLVAMLAGVVRGQSSIGAVLNGASYSAVLAPGCWATIFGENLAGGPLAAQSVPLPRELGGVTVTVGGAGAELLYVSPKQINFLIPYEVAIPERYGKPTAVVVTRSGGGTASYSIHLSRVAPALFSRDASGTGRALVFNSRFEPAESLAAGDVVILYAAGLGRTVPGGVVAEPVEIYMGEQKLGANEVLFVGAAPGFPGVYQINLRVPVGVATDRLYLKAGGWRSNLVEFGLAPGNNAANVTGSIVGLYPAEPLNTPPYMMPLATGLRDGFSVVLTAGAFAVKLDVQAGAKPFAVAAVIESATAVIRIDPAAGTWQASNMVPTTATRFGDFAIGYPEYTMLDFSSCDGAVECPAAAGNRIPQARISPVVSYALRYVPLLEVPTSGFTGELKREGRLRADGRFDVTMQGEAPVAEFGGWLWLPYGPFATHRTILKLYVDGRVVAMREASYQLMHR